MPLPDPVVTRIKALPPRSVVAIVGAPGSGKSTVAEQLCTAIDGAALLPMDGYHYDDAVLRDLGRLDYKGAPDTFDVGGLVSTLRRLRQGGADVAVPVFDRDLEISRGSARIIPASARLIVVEGNYLLLNQPPWSDLHPLFDLTIALDVPEDELRRRLTARWQHYGLTPDQIAHKLDNVDLPNGRTIRAGSIPADEVVVQH